MLNKLTISNFAIVSELSLEFSAGLNVFTGETGAGKSILIEALGFLLGARGSSSWLRSGAERLSVTGVFSGRTVRRELDRGGKTRALIDGKTVPLAALAAFGEGLVDFHGQHEHQALLKPAVQMRCLDAFGGLEGQRAAVERAYEAWSGLKAELEAGRLSDEERARRLEFGSFQLSEIDAARLRPGEEEELAAALPRLQGGERLRALADSAYEMLYSQEGSALGLLLKAERALAELCRIDESLRERHEALQSARLAVDDVARAVDAYRESVEADPARLEAALSRSDALSRLKKKYGATVADILALREKVAADLSLLEGAGQRVGELEKELPEAGKRLDSACACLHKSRMKAARALSAALLKELKVLGMAQAGFSVSVELEEGRYSRAGGDLVEFLMAPNPGEPLRPVKAIASGGELARVMLALKTVLADDVPVLVFDEVDAGIGGLVARAVGERLSRLAASRQVLCVTHLPQVACFAQTHFQVAKEVASGRTTARVERLDGARRLEAVARMLGGREATAASRKHAQELLENSLA
jgi:DNA repair protein RecN (Recombination protein N)